MSIRQSICPDCGSTKKNDPTLEGEGILAISKRPTAEVDITCENGHTWKEHRKTLKGSKMKVLW